MLASAVDSMQVGSMANEVARALRRRMTSHEVRLWGQLRALREQGLHFRRQVPLGAYVVDFACLRARIVIEVDGNQHGMPREQARDRARDEALFPLGYKVLRIWNTDLNASVTSVVDTIYHHAAARAAARDTLGRLG